MKRLQTRVFAILCFNVFLCFAAQGQQPQSMSTLARGDSLFRNKHYTESFEIYQNLFQQKKYSQAMLLKMAFIQEGLGHLSQSLYFMNLYYKASHDAQALAKIEEIAAHNKLEGYSNTDADRIFAFLEEHYFRIAGAIASVVLLLLALEVYLKRKSKSIVVPLVFQIFFIIVLAVQMNFSFLPTQGIVANPATYLMSGPSAGAPVISILGEGHQLEIVGRRDVWLKVKWMDRDGYVKENAMLAVRL
jgi:hypothetical protein